MKQEIDSLDVGSLRQFILDTQELEYSEADVAKMKKAECLKIVKDYMQQLSDNASDFSLKYEEEEFVPNSIQETVPQYGSDEWQEYVVSLLRPDEFFDGSPKMSGLRRVAQMLLGDIVHSGAESVSVVPQEDSRAVTVNYKVVFAWKLDFGVNAVDISKAQFDLRTFMGMADCIENRDCMFARHPAATAETKAMARAFKTALCINVVTADEKLSGYTKPREQINKDDTGKPAPPNLLKTVKNWGQASNVDHLKVLRANMKEITGGLPKDFEELTEKEVKKLFSIMSSEKHD